MRASIGIASQFVALLEYAQSRKPSTSFLFPKIDELHKAYFVLQAPKRDIGSQ